MMPACKDPGEELMSEHGLLRRVLRLYRESLARIVQGRPVPWVALRGCVRFVQTFIESAHEVQEERYVFPVAQAPRATIRTLIAQHRAGRALHRALMRRLPVRPRQRPTLTELRVIRHHLGVLVPTLEAHAMAEDTEVFPTIPARRRALVMEGIEAWEQVHRPLPFADARRVVRDLERAFGFRGSVPVRSLPRVSGRTSDRTRRT